MLDLPSEGAVEETLHLLDAGPDRIGTAWLLQRHLSLGVKEAHALVAGAPCEIAAGAADAVKEALYAKLLGCGASVELRPGRAAPEG